MAQKQLPVLGSALPKWVVLQLIEHCNLRCRMCYEWGDNGTYRDNGKLSKLSLEVVEKIIEDCKPQRPYYELFGGEPLMYPHIAQVLRAIQAAGSKVHLPTNGTLLERYAELLVETAPDRIWVSLDGPAQINDAQRGDGVYEKAVRGIEKLYTLRQSRGATHPHIGICFIITPLNYRYIEATFFEALDLGKLDCISLELQAYLTERDHRDYASVLRRHFGVKSARLARGLVCDPKVFAEVDCEEVERQVARVAEACKARGIYLNTTPRVVSAENIRKYFSADWFSMSHVKTRCAFPWLSTEINARGEVTSCHTFYDLTLGNVNESSLREIWQGERYAQYRAYLRKNLLPICQSCCLFYNEKPPF